MTIAEKLWTERILLAQSPLWIIAVGWVTLTGALRSWSDIDYILFSLAVAAPSILLPAVIPLLRDAGADGESRFDQIRHEPRPWHERYWVKLNIWVFIVVSFGTYFGTHYFFDLMGMRYNFDVRCTLESPVIGQSGQKVPLFMYPLTHAYFMTYFTVLIAADREIARRLELEGGVAGRFIVVVGLSYAVAFAETYFMASPLLSDLFAYANRERMLSLGSLGYASYFVVGLPMVRRIDHAGECWSLERVVLEALATCMAILVVLEIWAQLVGPL